MKIFCFSDYHNDEQHLPAMRKSATEADIVVSAGDHSIFEFDQDKALAAFNEWKKQVYLFHGNHEEESTLRNAVKRYKHLAFIHAEERITNNVRLLAWGGGGFTTHDRDMEKQVEEWRGSKHQGLPTILITHVPPYNTKLDVVHGRHVGSKSVRKAIEELQPTYAVSGHIHECAGAQDKVGKTTCYNLGPKGRMITL